MLKLKNCLPAIALLIFLGNISLAQSVILGQEGQKLPITAAPFLQITPDARTAGLGEAGVASSPDANAAYWNPAKLVLLPERSNLAFSYTPWLSKVVSDMYLYHMSAAQKLAEKNALGLSVTYFDMGDIQLTNASGTYIFLENPHDLSISLSYAHKLGKQWSVGGSAKYIESNYAATSTASGNPQNSVGLAVDLGALYQTEMALFQQNTLLALGINLANLGPKMHLLGTEQFLPANLSLGSSLSSQLTSNHRMTWLVHLSKLLVPSPPVYELDQNGQIIGMTGKDPNRGWFSGTFGSFTDAPDGFSEELSEIRIGTGLEYAFKESVELRAGYYRDSQDKGDRRYFTTGLGLRYRVISLDLAYLLPSGTKPGRTHPLQETLRVGLQLRFGGKV
ncbi:type IX secretion system outer membrane channel protein PorV [Catalinimonas niigatensis]|uniref:type IX secretion system outer membrane channel protein PorV n=1 Tax=Catalinimonas niigatensis TaxID=1397264 RepID=UPI00266685CC|nr:type IX secretion system outer membrane channel protein PorV [Catalinimonas niigatensis]WPP48485.1 type IX secretion system outer membrane channel protein PorV [Catalinimonas niigatensis]